METVLEIISILAQTGLCAYFVLSLSKILDNKKYTTSQIIITLLISLISTVSCSLIKGLFPFSNTILSWILMFINLKTFLKTTSVKASIIVISSFALLGISEMIILFISTAFFNEYAEVVVQNKYIYIILTILQLILSVISVNIIKLLFKKFTNLNHLINQITSKQLLALAILLCLCILPQLLFSIFNKYNYPWQILLLNAIQITTAAFVILIYFNTSVEKDKVQSDLVTSELHNKTMVGMVDGVRTLKHDYNNIMQALNGYIVTKNYDKLQEHINKVLKECNVVNTLSVIDPKIFNDPAIYGIVGAKYFLALGKDITMDLDIVTNIAEIQFSMPELSRILGILLDNAIEATSKLEQKKQYIRLEMKFDNRKCADIIRVINTYDTNINIDLESIYKKGVSSKKVKSGIGLWEVKKLISKVPNSQIYPTIEKDKFVQNIIIKKN